MQATRQRELSAKLAAAVGITKKDAAFGVYSMVNKYGSDMATRIVDVLCENPTMTEWQAESVVLNTQF